MIEQELQFDINDEEMDITHTYDVTIEFTYSITPGRYSGPPCQCYPDEESFDYTIEELTHFLITDDYEEQRDWDGKCDADEFMGRHAADINEKICEWLNENA